MENFEMILDRRFQALSELQMNVIIGGSTLNEPIGGRLEDNQADKNKPEEPIIG